MNTYPYGGFWLRVVAYLIDAIVIGIPIAVISLLIFTLFMGSLGIPEILLADSIAEVQWTEAEILTFLSTYMLSLLVIMVINICLSIVYFAGFHSSKWQATIGKKVIGLKVTDMYGKRISFWRGVGRYIAMSLLSGIFFIGYIMVAFTEKKQGLHDLIVHTVVIQTK